MNPSDRRIVLVTRKTRLDELVERYNTVEQARFYVEHLGADFSDYEAERERYRAAVAETSEVLGRHGRLQRLDRSFLPNFLFAPDALVVVLGQDGLVANTLKYLSRHLVIGVNPEPSRWDGVLLPFESRDLATLVPEALAGRRPTRRVTMARVRLSDRQELHAVNDIFVGPKSHVSARYDLRLGGRQERQSSSGLIVSTGLGSTGWFRSLLTGAAGISGREPDEVAALRAGGFAWDADHLYFTVREPFPSRTSETGLVFGRVTRETPLRIVSQMAGQGVIFSDGIEADFLEFNAGMEAVVDVADKEGLLVT